MCRRPRALLAALAITVCAACASRPTPRPDPTAGRELLEDYTRLLREVAMSASAPELEPELARLEARAATKHDGHEVGAEFHGRYARLIRVTRAGVAPQGDAQEIAAFVREVHPAPPVEAEGFAALGPALLEEVLNLHLLVEPQADREALRRHYTSGR